MPSSAWTTGIFVALASASRRKLVCVGSRCWTSTNAIRRVRGRSEELGERLEPAGRGAHAHDRESHVARLPGRAARPLPRPAPFTQPLERSRCLLDLPGFLQHVPWSSSLGSFRAPPPRVALPGRIGTVRNDHRPANTAPSPNSNLRPQLASSIAIAAHRGHSHLWSFARHRGRRALSHGWPCRPFASRAGTKVSSAHRGSWRSSGEFPRSRSGQAGRGERPRPASVRIRPRSRERTMSEIAIRDLNQ